jgi:hypothetical protein
VDTVAVGAGNLGHLRGLLEALQYETDGETIHRYRSLLRERAGRQPA